MLGGLRTYTAPRDRNNEYGNKENVLAHVNLRILQLMLKNVAEDKSGLSCFFPLDAASSF